MKRISYLMVPFLLLSVLLLSCDKDDDPTTEPEETEVTLDNTINNFVWKGMNSWYNWQTNVGSLADSQDDTTNDYYTFLNGFSTPETLFNSLLFEVGNTDRFSWFIEDYVEQEKSFQGVTVSTGISRSNPILIAENEIIIYVQYVSEGSPADLAGVKRGDIINAIDGEIMNETNYASVINKLYSGSTIVVSTASEANGVLSPLNEYTIAPTEVSDNAIHFTKVFDDINGRKVGYLVYNGFRSAYNDELNDVFAEFKAAGVNELILDLRSNGGGSVATSAYLASMIYKNAGTDTFAELNFNSKHSNENGAYDFGNELYAYDINGNYEGTEVINRLENIDRLYVLTSGSTASASEMIINGLKPFMPVTLIGETTYGKNVGSITLYDSPTSDYTNQSSAKTYHQNAMQPIVFQIYNKLGESDYTLGFTPDVEVKEWYYWKNILPYGDENEALLKVALDDIRGVSTKEIYKAATDVDILELESSAYKFEKEMYIGEEFFNKN